MAWVNCRVRREPSLVPPTCSPPDGPSADASMAADAEWVIADTSAVLAYVADEPEAKTVAGYRSRLAIPFIALTELTYLAWQRQGEEEAVGHYTLVTKWGRPILWPDE